MLMVLCIICVKLTAFLALRLVFIYYVWCDLLNGKMKTRIYSKTDSRGFHISHDLIHLAKPNTHRQAPSITSFT